MRSLTLVALSLLPGAIAAPLTTSSESLGSQLVNRAASTATNFKLINGACTLSCPAGQTAYYGTCIKSCTVQAISGFQGAVSVVQTSNSNVLGNLSSIPSSGFYGIYPAFATNGIPDLSVTINPSARGILFRTLRVVDSQVVDPAYPFFGMAHSGGPIFDTGSTGPSYGFLTPNQADIAGGGPGANVFITILPPTVNHSGLSKRAATIPALGAGISAIWRVDACTFTLTATYTNPDQVTFLPLQILFDNSSGNIVLTTNTTELVHAGIGSSANLVPVTLKFIRTA